ncbi:MAG: hypothetical protein LBT98_02075 [Puniceicoccales bacterium]|jgi:chromosome segregation ATPase|nr:hypothetical protein [Puniceicoccales bacterium]
METEEEGVEKEPVAEESGPPTGTIPVGRTLRRYGPLLWSLMLISLVGTVALGWVLGRFYFQRAQVEETVRYLREEAESVAGRVDTLRRAMRDRETSLEEARVRQEGELQALELAKGEAQSRHEGELRALQLGKSEMKAENRRLQEELVRTGEEAGRRRATVEKDLQQLESRQASEMESFQKNTLRLQEQLQAAQGELTRREAEVSRRTVQVEALVARQGELERANAELERQRETEKRLRESLKKEKQEAAELEARIEELAQRHRRLSTEVIAEEANLKNAMRRQAEYAVTEERLREIQEVLRRLEAVERTVVDGE